MKSKTLLLVLLSSCCLVSCSKESSPKGQSPAADPVSKLYNQSCISCHGSGAAGAPRAHDVSAWQPRMEQGMEVLLENTRKGIGAMPPMGMCMYCTDEDFTALIRYMASAP